MAKKPEALRKLEKALKAQGFTVEPTKGNHWEVRGSNGIRATTYAGTSSDRRGDKNSLAQLKRAGFVWDR